jgi:hypothetical protein
MSDEPNNIDVAGQIAVAVGRAAQAEARADEALSQVNQLLAVVQQLADAVNDQDDPPDVDITGDKVIQVAKVGDGFHLSAKLPQPGPVVCFVEITGNSGSAPQWTYTGRIVDKTGAGHGNWSTTGPTVTTVYNTMEELASDTPWNNGASSTDPAISPNTVVLQPIPNGVIVACLITGGGAGVVEYWFTAPNGLKVTCGGGA